MRIAEVLYENIDTSNLPKIINSTRKAYNDRGISTYDIGNGECENFIYDVMRQLKRDDWVEGSEFQIVETLNFVIQTDEYEIIDWDWDLLKKHWNMSPPDGVTLEQMKLLAQYHPTHVWLTVDTKHYDAEAPNGVNTFFELPFFKRWIDWAKTQ